MENKDKSSAPSVMQSQKTAKCNTVIVGTGAAGYNAALRLFELGVHDIMIVTEGVTCGTSRNTGSDKQTYYKLSVAGGVPDSVRDMALDLFGGGAMDGDTALAEAALSAPSFFSLASMGVPFPHNEYGEYVGYRTDHDTRGRATSAGPLTSRFMTEALENAVRERGIAIRDDCAVIEILRTGERAAGLITLASNGELGLIRAKNIIWATGGPAAIYADSVYPSSHAGATGIALEAGVTAQNLTEWQYGLASVAPRWNVSGTYMQVLPMLVSVDDEGVRREFLREYYDNDAAALGALFRKGYEWPFDTRRVPRGSSMIDLYVHRETQSGRRVFLDYRQNPFGHDSLDFGALDDETRGYLESAGACFGSPIERLLHMNAPAYELYLSHGVDLRRDMLEIALCAQHHNGGLAVDADWQTNLRGFYAAGEAAGTHGIYRPGGSALNAGQVGGRRAASHIALHGTGEPMDEDAFNALAAPALKRHAERHAALLSNADAPGALSVLAGAARRMSGCAAAIRDIEGMKDTLAYVRGFLAALPEAVRVDCSRELAAYHRLRGALVCQCACLEAMLDYAAEGGTSRGSALYTDDGAKNPRTAISPPCFHERIQEVTYKADKCRIKWREVRPLPEGGGVFENVWREYRRVRGL